MKALEIAKKAKEASIKLNEVSMDIIDNALIKIASSIIENKEEILKMNEVDVLDAQKNGMNEILLDRLILNKEKIESLADNIIGVKQLASPLNKVVESNNNNGMQINKIITPLGVVLMIYEARPNVTCEAFSLALKTKNTIILRGSSTTLNTNKILVKIINEAGIKVGLPNDFIQLVESYNHKDTDEFLVLREYIDVVIPRGGRTLIQNIIQKSKIPIIETGTGNNFAYVDGSYDLDKTIDILINAKASRVSVCNSLEKILIHKDVCKEFHEILYKRLKEKNIEIRVCEKLEKQYKNAILLNKDDLDFEYLDYKIGIKAVDNLNEAIELINLHSSKHSNLILSNNYQNIESFLNRIDAACVYVNASTRFSDGVEFGLGSEIGISTQKIHARGPMGLNALTSTKYIIYGNGNIRV